MVWIKLFESLTWGKFLLSAKTECIGSSVYYDVQSELIQFTNALWERVKPDRADIRKRWISLEVEKVVHYCIKVRFNSATFDDEFRVRYFMGPSTVCFEHQMSWKSIFDWAFSVLISFKILVGNVPHSISGRCCVGISFFPSLFFLLLTQKHWRKWIQF